MHLAIKSGTNMALMNALIHELIANGWYDEGYVEAHTIGFEKLKATVSEYPPEKAAEICGVPAEEIREAARIIGEAESMVSTALQGFYQSMSATAAGTHFKSCAWETDEPRAPRRRTSRFLGHGHCGRLNRALTGRLRAFTGP